MNILVTGCSRGVGLAICKAFLEKGHIVYGVSRSYTDDFKRLESEYQDKLFFKSFDLADSENVKAELFDNYISNSIPLDCFVNNAAQAYDDIITNLHLQNLEKMYKVNVFTPFMIVKYAIRNMIFNRKPGSIIHISSISAHTGYKGLAMYASAKGALEAFSKNTAREWGEKGIRSNVVVPGFMDTEMSSSLTDEQKSRIYKRTSLKKATEVDSVAETVLFLAGEGAISITGQNFHVDAGTI
jgi:3-oxoacyl-[acyl-carrier protein] reductase